MHKMLLKMHIGNRDYIFSLNVKLILLFTTGETALSLSKLHAPCPIVAVTAKKTIARNLNIVNGVIPLLVGSLYGIE